MRSAGNLRRQRGDRTAAGDVIEVINVEVRIDQRLELAAASRLFNRVRETIPKLLQTLLEGLREQMLFALEMAIEPAVREVQVAHQLADRRLAPLHRNRRGAARTIRSRVCCLCSALYRILCYRRLQMLHVTSEPAST